jgi:hypothetical protein
MKAEALQTCSEKLIRPRPHVTPKHEGRHGERNQATQKRQRVEEGSQHVTRSFPSYAGHVNPLRLAQLL